jgi:hypothetical protein
MESLVNDVLAKAIESEALYAAKRLALYANRWQDEGGYIKGVGWRVVRDIYKKRDSIGIYLEGYYLRHSRTLFEEGYQRVYVKSRPCDPTDDVWHIITQTT